MAWMTVQESPSMLGVDQMGRRLLMLKGMIFDCRRREK
jgi:hypothetical protein